MTLRFTGMKTQGALLLAVAFTLLVATGWSGEAPTNRSSVIAPAVNVLSNLVKSVRSSSKSAPQVETSKLEVKEVSLGRIPKDMLFESAGHKG